MDVAAPPPPPSPPPVVLLVLELEDVIVANISSAGGAGASSDMKQGKGPVRESQDVWIVSPDRQSDVSEGEGPGHVGTHSVVYPAVGPPVAETAVVRHPGDKQVVGLCLMFPEDVPSPGGELRQLSIALREADRQLLQDGAAGAAPRRLAVTGAGQAGASQRTVQLSLATLGAPEQQSWGGGHS